MDNAYNITTDKPVFAINTTPTEEDRFGCIECAAEAIYVSASESGNRKPHFRHGPYLIDAGWLCSLLSGKREHKNSTKNYRKITELYERGHISKNQIWDYYVVLLKNKDFGLKEYKGVNGALVAKVRDLEAVNGILVAKVRDLEAQLNRKIGQNTDRKVDTEITAMLARRTEPKPVWEYGRGKEDYISPPWLEVELEDKAEQLAKKHNRIHGHDRVYKYINVNSLENSCRNIMKWVANPQTPEAVQSGQYIAKKVYENNSKFELQDLLGALVTTERNPERREVVQQFLKIILLETYEIQGKK
jgi:hypothetical protein